MTRTTRAAIGLAIGATGLALSLGGCSYDYLNHSDRVAYSEGDAVKANLEAETINPAKRSMSNTRGLGKNGLVNPDDLTSGGTAPTASTAKP